MKRTLFGFTAAALLTTSSASGGLLISGMVDGTNNGGNPKAMEVVALENIADLSVYWILRDTNGTTGGPFTQSDSFQLPSVSLSAGDFYYIYGNSDTETQLEAAGFGDTDSGTAVRDGILNQNGDDIFALSTSNDVADAIDAFGLLGQGDTNFAQNSTAYRPDGSPQNATGVADAGNFDITAYGSDSSFNAIFGTFQVPEPSSLALIGLGGLLIARRRRD